MNLSPEFYAFCTAAWIAYEPLIKVWAGVFAATGTVVAFVLGFVVFFRRAFLGFQ